MNIYLVRHGETEWNSEGRFQGRLDSALTARGSEQAARAGRRLASLVPPGASRLLTSPLGRTRQTSAIVSHHMGCPAAILDPRLAEVTLGSWDGLTQLDIDVLWPGRLDGSTPFDWYFHSPDGESYSAAMTRARDWLDDMEGTVIAISHGLMGRLIRGAYASLEQSVLLGLPVPQDVIWHLRDGAIDAIPV